MEYRMMLFKLGNFLSAYYLYMLYNFYTDANITSIQVGRDQYHSWASLGFIRSIALSESVKRSLSTNQWLQLLMKVIAEEHVSVGASNIAQQVKGW